MRIIPKKPGVEMELLPYLLQYKKLASIRMKIIFWFELVIGPKTDVCVKNFLNIIKSKFGFCVKCVKIKKKYLNLKLNIKKK